MFQAELGRQRGPPPVHSVRSSDVISQSYTIILEVKRADRTSFVAKDLQWVSQVSVRLYIRWDLRGSGVSCYPTGILHWGLHHPSRKTLKISVSLFRGILTTAYLQQSSPGSSARLGINKAPAPLKKTS